MNLRHLMFVLGAFLLVTGCSRNEQHSLPEFSLSKRPVSEELLFDYAGTFKNIEESTRRSLDALSTLYGIEACIVTLTESPGKKPIQHLAVEILNNWHIGRAYNGKGILFVFIESNKQVKFEVGYELEDVFTDAFSGYIEDLQLKPNYRKGNLEVGIIAVFEEVEKRAEIKKLGNYTQNQIADFDAELLSGGGGASKKLSAYKQTGSEKQTGYPLLELSESNSAATPGKAWEIMLDKWTGGSTYQDIDIYTEATKMAMGNQNDPNDKRVTSQAKLLLKVPYSVKQDRNVALIHFNSKKGWESAPYLFAHDGIGWKFDIVSQRKYVVFGSKGSWHLERGDHVYNTLFNGFKNGLRKDIPLADDIAYDVTRDREIAEKITVLEKRFSVKSQPDFDGTLELGRLGVVTARRPQHVYTPLNKAKELSGAAMSHKYLAVYHVMSNFQYESALQEIQIYNKKTNTVYGLNFQGFLHHKLGEFDKAAKYFNRSLKIQPSVYALCKLSRAEAMLYANIPHIDTRRTSHKEKAIKAYFSAKELSPDSWRVSMLENWLRQKGILNENSE